MDSRNKRAGSQSLDTHAVSLFSKLGTGATVALDKIRRRSERNPEAFPIPVLPTGPAESARADTSTMRKPRSTRDPNAARPRSSKMHRTTVVYPPGVLHGLKIAAIRDRSTVGDLVRAALTAGLMDPGRLAVAAEDYVGVRGTRTTIDLPVDEHRRLKMLAAKRGVTLQSIVMAAIADAYPDLSD